LTDTIDDSTLNPLIENIYHLQEPYGLASQIINSGLPHLSPQEFDHGSFRENQVAFVPFRNIPSSKAGRALVKYRQYIPNFGSFDWT
jgi:hypothetical protein